jgi:hypothetical protein
MSAAEVDPLGAFCCDGWYDGGWSGGAMTAACDAFGVVELECEATGVIARTAAAGVVGRLYDGDELIPAELIPAGLIPAELIPAELIPAGLIPAGLIPVGMGGGKPSPECFLKKPFFQRPLSLREPIPVFCGFE